MKKKAIINFSIIPKDDPKQALRIRRFFMAVAAYALAVSIAYFSYLVGFTEWKAIVGLLIMASIINISLYIIFRTGLNLKMADPSLTALQMCVASLVVMYGMYFANESRGVLLLSYIIILLFGIFRLNTRSFLYISIFTLLTYGIDIALLKLYHPQDVNFNIEYLQWVVLALVLVTFSIIGGYISSLRTKISKDSSTIKHLTDNIHDVVFVLDMNLNYTYVSPSVKILRGYEPEEVMKQAPLDAMTPSSLDLASRTLSEAMELEKLEHKEDISRTIELEIRQKDGTTVWTETKLSFIRDKNQRPLHILGVMRDITDRKRIEEKLQFEEKRFRAFVEHSSDMIVLVNPEGVILYVNPAIESILGFKPEERIGFKGSETVHPDDIKALADVFNTLSTDTNSPVMNAELRLRHKDGSWRTLEAVGSNLVNNNVVESIIINYRDITERKQAEEQIQYLATHDLLTDLPSLRFAKDRLSVALNMARRYKKAVAVMFIDLDGFKDVNDTLGHDTGDYVLQQVAKRLLSCVRETDTVTRIGGDEFLIIATEINAPENVAQIAEKVIHLVSQPIIFNGRQSVVTASIGIALFPDDGQDMDQLIKKADEAMYSVKKAGKNGFRFINPKVN
jgi:diguanylate cyclase (GGDEF)-like protein/PAS domain S-box-containing protein